MTDKARFAVWDYPGKGRGLRAMAPFAAGELIAASPVLILPEAERLKVVETLIRHYYFVWEEAADGTWSAALALGPVSLCNHTPTPNARFALDHDRRCIDLFAARTIEAGEEITIDYDCDLWFEQGD